MRSWRGRPALNGISLAWAVGVSFLIAASPAGAQAAGPAAPPAQAPAQPDAVATAIADLVAANHVLAKLGVLDGYGHVSVRSPVNSQHFFISRSLAPALVTAADIVELDEDGNPVKPTSARLYLERFIHAAAYRARPDVNAVLHSHSAGVLPFSVTDVPLRAVTHDAAFLGQGVPVFDADADGRNGTMLISTMDLARKLVATLKDGAVALIRGHGDIVVGPSIAGLVGRAINVDKNSEVEKAALALGRPITYLTPSEIEARAKLMSSLNESRDWDMLKTLYGG